MDHLPREDSRRDPNAQTRSHHLGVIREIARLDAEDTREQERSLSIYPGALFLILTDMPNIYNLPQEVEKALNAYYDCFDPDTGELAVSEEELTAAQSALEELQNQSDEILKWYLEDRANRLARIAMFENEVDRLKAHLKREAREVDRTNLLIGRAFERVYAGKPLNIGTFTLSYRNSAAV